MARTGRHDPRAAAARRAAINRDVAAHLDQLRRAEIEEAIRAAHDATTAAKDDLTRRRAQVAAAAAAIRDARADYAREQQHQDDHDQDDHDDYDDYDDDYQAPPAQCCIIDRYDQRRCPSAAVDVFGELWICGRHLAQALRVARTSRWSASTHEYYKPYGRRRGDIVEVRTRALLDGMRTA